MLETLSSENSDDHGNGEQVFSTAKEGPIHLRLSSESSIIKVPITQKN